MLEHVSITNDADERYIICKAVNAGNDSHLRIKRSKIIAPLFSWRTRLKEILSSERKAMSQNYVFNRKRLNAVLSSIEAACKYNGEFAYIVQTYFSGGYIWKSYNELTNQTVLIAHLLIGIGNTPEVSGWEQSFYNKQKVVIRRKV
jgi:hypothetical protein